MLKPGLYIVSTPIGNMEDITYRAAKTLSNSDCIIAEDTRITKKLLDKYQIKTKLLTYNDHSDDRIRRNIIEMITAGRSISLVSDAGTPLISDPGYKLARILIEMNIHVDAIPGPCSPIMALTLSALPTDRFMFCGFVPKTKQAKESFFNELKFVNATMVCFESAARLGDTISIALGVLSDREAVIARELTKMYQEIKRGLLSEFIHIDVRGEVVLLIRGHEAAIDDQETIIGRAKMLLGVGLSAKDVVNVMLVDGVHLSKNELYQVVNRLKSL